MNQSKVKSKLFFKNIWISISVILLIFQLACSTKNQEISSIKNGFIEINNLDSDKSNWIALNGESLFYWKQWPINDKGEYDASLLIDSKIVSWPPALWTSGNYESRGFGTYRFVISQEKINDLLVLNFDRVLGALEIWINGKKYGQLGSLSRNGNFEKLDGRPFRIELPQEDKLDIMLLVSNHNNRLGGGFPLQNKIQTKSKFEAQQRVDPLIEGLITLFIIIFGLYELYKFYVFKNETYFLYFGLFCLIGASRQLFVGEALIYSFFPDISFDIVQKMRYIGYYGGLSLMILYHNALFPGYFSKPITKILAAIPLLGIFYVFFSPIFYATLSAPYFQVYGLLMVILAFYLVIKATIDKRPYAFQVLFILVILVCMFINDILNAMLLIQTKYIVNYGILFYVIFQLILNHKIQKNRERLLVELSSNIDHLQSDIDYKLDEIKKLRKETFQHIKSKEKLVEHLKKAVIVDSSISIQNIIANLKSELLEDSQILNIKSDIETLNREFIQRLKKIHPNLTKTDLEICTYLRMSIGRKEIARLRFTSSDAVKKSRNRLRKKMELSVDIDLEAYLKSI